MLINLSEITGIGKSKEKKLADAGIMTPLDLALYFPRRYIDLSKTEEWQNAADGESVLIKGQVDDKPKTAFVRKLRIISAKCSAKDRQVSLVWFNLPYITGMLVPGVYYFFGKISRTKNTVKLTNPLVIKDKDAVREVFAEYKSVGGLSNQSIRAAVAEILAECRLDSIAGDDYDNLMPLKEAVRKMHFPESLVEAKEASERIVTEQIIRLIISYRLSNERSDSVRINKYTDFDSAPFFDALPFSFTEGQKSAADDIVRDLKGGRSMNRIITGDVGSGKTAVAFFAMYIAAVNGYQSALMCPTEILAEQHYGKIIALFDKLNIRSALLTSSLSRQQRDQVLFNIREGVAQIVIGTHSLLSEEVTFKKLAMVVTDEQHRFGVNQRKLLLNKSKGADVLVMSATPIPRTVSLMLFGELDSSGIPDKPHGRYEVKTNFVPKAKINAMWEYIANTAKTGAQTYVICSQIGSDDEDGDEDGEEKAVSSAKLYKSLSTGALSGVRTAHAHGRTDTAERTRIMNDFAAGRIDVLISTTIVEVGMDVAGAKNIVIFNAERYGLSQLHQLRGRVGRDGKGDSNCFLIADKSIERLQILKENHDGFALAEYDLKSRGAGDFIGTRQHGNNLFGYGIITEKLLEKAKSCADDLLSDPEMAEKLNKMLSDEQKKYYEKISLN